MSPDLEKLIALHEIDQKLNEYRAQIDTFTQECAQIEAQYQQFAAGFYSAKENLSAAQKQLRQLESDLTETQQHHEKYKDDLMKVRNQKEYEVALREIDVAKKSISQLETQILETMEEIKRLEAELEQFSPDIENKRHDADAALVACRARQAKHEQDIANMLRQRSELEGAVTKPWLDRYNRIAKLRTGQALSEVINGACSVCRMTLRPQVFSEVRQGDIIFICDHCSRILYYRPEVKTELVKA